MMMTIVSQPRLEELHQQQMRDPGNLVLAHDIGLAHLWQARKRCGQAATDAVWLRVIANFAIVLASETYWRDWCAERSVTYGRNITDAHITAVRQKVAEWLTAELASAAEAGSSGEINHLEALFHLESKCIRLLQEGNKFFPASAVTIKVLCGPLLTRQLNLSQDIQMLFQSRPISVPGKEESLRTILTAVQQDDNEIQTAVEGPPILFLYFSQLGLPAIYLEQKNPQQALDVLATLRCERCASKANVSVRLPDAGNLPTWHRADCPDFIRHNPSYAALAHGADLYRRHALELTISAHLSLAYHALVVKPANVAVLQENLRHALNASQELSLYEALQSELVNLVSGWAEGLANDSRLDDAITLLETTQSDFSRNGTWQGRLASLLNARGVQQANGGQWAESAADLRRAYALKPFSPQIRENLENVLYAYANAMYAAGNAQLARALHDEVIHLGEKVAVLPEKAPESVAATAVPEAVFKPRELAHPVIFDRHGRLQLAAFDAGGQIILSQAQAKAAAMGIDLIDVYVLLLALLQSPGNELSRLLKLQGLAPELLQDRVQVVVIANSSASNRLQEVTALSQFDFWSSAVEVLNTAWEVAQYDQGQIGETHLVYGLLLSPGISRLLAQAGADVNQMVTQVAWY